MNIIAVIYFFPWLAELRATCRFTIILPLKQRIDLHLVATLRIAILNQLSIPHHEEAPLLLLA